MAMSTKQTKMATHAHQAPAIKPTPVEPRKPNFREVPEVVGGDPEEALVGRRKARLLELIAREGSGGAAALARRCDPPRTTANINHMSRPGYHFGSRAARGLEAALGLEHMYFDRHIIATGASTAITHVPVIPWGSIGRFAAENDSPTIPVPWVVGPRAVAGISHGSMWGGDGVPGIPRGWHAVIDPDVAPREGDIVACWLPGATECTLRHFLTDAGRNYLYPLDPRHTSVDEWTRAVKVVGPVVGALRSFRA